MSTNVYEQKIKIMIKNLRRILFLFIKISKWDFCPISPKGTISHNQFQPFTPFSMYKLIYLSREKSTSDIQAPCHLLAMMFT